MFIVRSQNDGQTAIAEKPRDAPCYIEMLSLVKGTKDVNINSVQYTSSLPIK